MKHVICIFVILVMSSHSYAQGIVLNEETSSNCGINSAIGLAQALSVKPINRNILNSRYPTSFVTLLDVKGMCDQGGIRTTGVKGSIDELLENGTACIVGLKNPEHFLVLLDGNNKELRITEGGVNSLRVVPRTEIESRFTGYALLPVISTLVEAPKLEMRYFDQHQTFTGIGQKVDYHFPLRNTGKTALQVELVGTSCGCTAAVMKGNDPKNLALQSGAESEVVVSYHVQTQAPIQQTVTLKTNDPRHPMVYLSIRGELPPQLALSPPAIYVDQNLGDEIDKRFKVIGPKSLHIQKVWSDLPYLQFHQNKEELDGERTSIPVEIYGFAHAPAGSIHGRVNIGLSNGQEMFVQIRGTIDNVLPGEAQAALLPRAEDDNQAPIGSPLPTLKVGDKALDLTADDAHGNTWRLSDLRGQKNVLVTFFPKCFTGGCATQLSSIRDHQSDFDASQTQVLAVSVDAAEGEKGQLAFAKQWGFQFPLIPDTKRILGKQFGAIQNDDERAARLTFLIDKQGIVRWIDTDVHVETHGTDVLAKIHELGLDKP